MEFGIEKGAMLVRKSGKPHMTDRMELPNYDNIRTLGENETYKYMGILEQDTIKQKKDKIRKEYNSGTRNYSRQNCLAETSSKLKNTKIIKWVSRLFSYGHFYWLYIDENLVLFERIPPAAMHLFYYSSKLWKALWKSSCISVSMTVRASFISSVVS